MNVYIWSLIVFVACNSNPHGCNGEYFSSMDSLQVLGGIESNLTRIYRQFITMQKREFADYRKFLAQIKLQHNVALKDVEDYTSNPLNAFMLIKRVVSDWPHMHELIKSNTAHKYIVESLDKINKEERMPDEAEMRGAAAGLTRLQNVYDLDAHDLANGEINGIYYGSELSWHDTIEIAISLFHAENYPAAIKWFEVGLHFMQRVQEEKEAEINGLYSYDKYVDDDAFLEDDNNELLTLEKRKIESLEYLALAHYKMGDSNKAISYMDYVVKSVSNHTSQATLDYIRNTKPIPSQFNDEHSNSLWYKNYTRLCQGKRLADRLQHKLKCRIETKNNPYFVLAPLKIEEIHDQPEITVYHGMLNDDQIEKVLTETDHMDMYRSQVVNNTSYVVRDIRVSQQTWLEYESTIMKMIYRLVTQVTGLDLSNAETMQVANYGIGGQYEPHHDYFGETYEGRWPGDRIATTMFYLSDVEQGGYTAFPQLNVFSPPEKGALVMWYNLHRSLVPNHLTLHSGCPVVKGSKRISNIWIHSGYQELRRPCGLVNDA